MVSQRFNMLDLKTANSVPAARAQAAVEQADSRLAGCEARQLA